MTDLTRQISPIHSCIVHTSFNQPLTQALTIHSRIIDGLHDTH